MVVHLKAVLPEQRCSPDHILDPVPPPRQAVDFVVQHLHAQLHPRGAEAEHALYLLFSAPVGAGLDAKPGAAVLGRLVALFGFFQVGRILPVQDGCIRAVQAVEALLDEPVLVVLGESQEGAPHHYQLDLIGGVSHFA
ncbi:hypothetical protein ES703_99341 [subsurface metagenome]